MKRTIRLLLAMLALTACADLAAPPDVLISDTQIAAARAVSPGATTTLPTFGGSFAQAEAINDAGMVVGYATEASPSRGVVGAKYAARWVRNLAGQWQVTRLGAAGGHALALNELGDAVGTRNGATPVVWPSGGGEIELSGGAVAEGINSAGVIVGGTTWNNSSTAIVWTPDAASVSGWTARALPPLEGGTLSHAFAINEGGVIAGSAASASGRWQAVIWPPTLDGWSAPIPLSGTGASLGNSGGFGLNASGDVVGYLSSCNGCAIRAFFWPSSGGSIDLAALHSSTSSGHARGVEDGGRVVGFVATPRKGASAFLWAPGAAVLTNIGTGEANDINNRTARYGQEAVGFSRGSRSDQAKVWRVP